MEEEKAKRDKLIETKIDEKWKIARVDVKQNQVELNRTNGNEITKNKIK